jgi:hypothetical protein
MDVIHEVVCNFPGIDTGHKLFRPGISGHFFAACLSSTTFPHFVSIE